MVRLLSCPHEAEAQAAGFDAERGVFEALRRPAVRGIAGPAVFESSFTPPEVGPWGQVTFWVKYFAKAVTCENTS